MSETTLSTKATDAAKAATDKAAQAAVDKASQAAAPATGADKALQPVISAAVAATAPASAPIPEAGPADGKLIILAEDDPFISRMYQIKLQSAGFRVIVKNNGRDAFEAIKSERPNMAVLDINMPELTGLEVLAALQNDNYDFDTMPVIVLTNSSELSDRNKAHSFGADYLVKAELTPREVLNLINDKLAAQSGESSSASHG